jgi:hypothetical protein
MGGPSSHQDRGKYNPSARTVSNKRLRRTQQPVGIEQGGAQGKAGSRILDLIEENDLHLLHPKENRNLGKEQVVIHNRPSYSKCKISGERNSLPSVRRRVRVRPPELAPGGVERSWRSLHSTVEA